MNSSRSTHFDLHTPVEPAKRLESFPECPWVLISVLMLGTQWFVWTNVTLLVGARMRYSMTQAFFMPFTNTCLAAVAGRVLTRSSAHA
jgi:hypothetical protein